MFHARVTYVEFLSKSFDVGHDSLPDIPSARTDVDHDDDIKIAFRRWFLFAVASTSLLKKYDLIFRNFTTFFFLHDSRAFLWWRADRVILHTFVVISIISVGDFRSFRSWTSFDDRHVNKRIISHRHVVEVYASPVVLALDLVAARSSANGIAFSYQKGSKNSLQTSWLCY